MAQPYLDFLGEGGGGTSAMVLAAARNSNEQRELDEVQRLATSLGIKTRVTKASLSKVRAEIKLKLEAKKRQQDAELKRAKQQQAARIQADQKQALKAANERSGGTLGDLKRLGKYTAAVVGTGAAIVATGGAAAGAIGLGAGLAGVTAAATTTSKVLDAVKTGERVVSDLRKGNVGGVVGAASEGLAAAGVKAPPLPSVAKKGQEAMASIGIKVKAPSAKDAVTKAKASASSAKAAVATATAKAKTTATAAAAKASTGASAIATAARAVPAAVAPKVPTAKPAAAAPKKTTTATNLFTSLASSVKQNVQATAAAAGRAKVEGVKTLIAASPVTRPAAAAPRPVAVPPAPKPIGSKAPPKPPTVAQPKASTAKAPTAPPPKVSTTAATPKPPKASPTAPKQTAAPTSAPIYGTPVAVANTNAIALPSVANAPRSTSSTSSGPGVVKTSGVLPAGSNAPVVEGILIRPNGTLDRGRRFVAVA